MQNKTYNILTFLIASVWFINGFFAKILNLVPRHQAIVARILGNSNAVVFTKLIGVSEVVFAFWILSKYKSKISSILQVAIILTMNIIENIFARDLLLWGKYNLLFALLFSGLILINEFYFKKKQTQC